MAASYPTSIKSFLTYYDQPPGPTKVGPGGIDLTVDRAVVTNEIHDEVISIEQTIGPTASARFTTIPGTTTLTAEVNSLYTGKAWGRVDPDNDAIYPLSTPTHNHMHAEIQGNDADVHPQYMRVDGGRPFSAPCIAPDATAANELITLGQVTNAGWLNWSQVQFIIFTTVTTESAHTMIAGTSGGIDRTQRYRMTGGFTSGYTDSNGRIRIDYSKANFRGVLTLVYMKMPFPGPSAFGYIYQYPEDQLILTQVDNQGAWIQFTEDIVVDRQAWVAMTWMVVGV